MQSMDPKNTPYDDKLVNELLAKRGVVKGPDGRTLWKLKNGDVEVKPLREGGQLLATEIQVPLSERSELIREVVLESLLLATEAKLKVFDPQLARPLVPADDTAVADQYLKTAKYAGGVMGVSEAVGAAFTPAKEGFTPTTKMVVIALGALVILYIIMNSLMGSLRGE